MVAYRRDNWDFHAPWSGPRGQDELSVAVWRRRLEQWGRDERDSLAVRLMLFPRGDVAGSVLGTANFTQFMRGSFQACYLGYDLDKRAEGRGLMHEALGRRRSPMSSAPCGCASDHGELPAAPQPAQWCCAAWPGLHACRRAMPATTSSSTAPGATTS